MSITVVVPIAAAWLKFEKFNIYKPLLLVVIFQLTHIGVSRNAVK